jgi:predicted permease
MQAVRQDLRYAIRALRRTPAYTLAAVVTLGLGIGATTTIFTVVNSVLLRPLPYAESGRLANIWNDLGEGAQSLPAVSPADFRDYQRRSRTFESFAAASEANVVNLRGNLTGSGEPERVTMNTITWNFFPLLGIQAALGRNFTEAEEAVNGPHVVMITDGLWRRRYGADPSLVGRTIQIDGVAHTVVGILPPGFHLLLPAEAFVVTDAEVWAPLQFDYTQVLPRNLTFFTVFGRLRPGVTFTQAQDDMNRIAAEFRVEFPEHKASNLRIRAVPLHEDIVKHARPSLLVLLGAVGLTLLIACANVAHLLLVRATVREGEFALRAALGASRWAVVRQLLTESLVLAAAGGALGLAVAALAIGFLRALHPANLPRLGEIGIDPVVLAFTAAVCMLTSVGFGLVPAIQAARADQRSTLQSSGRGAGGGRQRIRDLLIVGEVALSVVLLVGAGLLIRSFIALQQVRPGFDPSDLLTFQVSFPSNTYPKGADRRTFLKTLEARLLAIPGVKSVGEISQLPLTGSGPLQPFAFNEETARNFESVTADGRNVSNDYFKTMNTRLLAGRYFTDDDKAGSPPVVIVAGPERGGQAAPGQPDGRPEHVRGSGRRGGASADARPRPRDAASDLPAAGAGDTPHACVRGRSGSIPPGADRGGAPSGGGARQGSAGGSSDADGGIRRRRHGASQIQPGADGRARGHRAVAGGGGDLRRNLVLRHATHARVRHPDRARRRPRLDPAVGDRPRDAAGRREHRHRLGGFARAGSAPRRAALPGPAGRPGHLHRHQCAARMRRAGGVLPPRAPSHAGRSGGGAEKRMTTPSLPRP